MQKNPHVKLVYTAIGGGAAGSDPFAPRGAAEVRKATLTINMTPRGERGGVRKQEVERQLREALAEIPGARITVGFGGSAEKYVLVLTSENGAVLAEHARPVERELRTIPGIGSVTTHREPGAPGARGPPRLRPRRRPGRHLGRDRRHAAHRHRRRLRPEPAQAQPAAAAGADRGQAARPRRDRTCACSSA